MRPLFVTLVLLLAACSRVVTYRPHEHAMEGLDAEGRHRLFAETLSRARKPRVGIVNVDDDSYTFEWQRTVHGPYGIPVAEVNEHDIGVYFANVARADLYTNHAVFVVGVNGRVLQKIVFENQQDAERFVDAITAMRAARLRR